MFGLGSFLSGQTQDMSIGIGYQYMWANEWDKAIQTYNFSTPELDVKQPLLDHGFMVNFKYVGKEKGYWSSGIVLGYAQHGSEAINPEFTTNINVKLAKLGYTVRCQPKERCPKIYWDASIFVTGAITSRTINGEIMSEEDPLRVKSIGGGMNMSLGYWMSLGDKLMMSPFAGISYLPVLWAPQGESALNLTNGLAGKRSTDAWMGQLGVRFHFGKRTASSAE